ncbi:MAG: hypothetical protein GZ091_07240 [Paludibacter sp.]|nr:hypothetical protein [Paludibacter sp.]
MIKNSSWKQLKCCKRLIILVIFVLISLKTIDCFAIDAPGYIINIQSDTIYGWVQLSRFDQVTGGLVLNGIEEESFHSRVVFVARHEKRFKTYFPEMLLGFGFTYNSTDYIFQKIIVQRKSIFKSEKQQYRFMRFVYEGNGGSRYKDVQLIPNPGLQMNEDEYIKYNMNLLRIKRNKKQTE